MGGMACEIKWRGGKWTRWKWAKCKTGQKLQNIISSRLLYHAPWTPCMHFIEIVSGSKNVLHFQFAFYNTYAASHYLYLLQDDSALDDSRVFFFNNELRIQLINLLDHNFLWFQHKTITRVINHNPRTKIKNQIGKEENIGENIKAYPRNRELFVEERDYNW